jgi:excisionase family DNA binding protein
MNFYQNENYLTGDEAAELAGVSRRTIYRWADEGRITTPFTRAEILNQEKRPRGPKRDPHSIRYTQGRHNRAGRNWQKASG